MGYKAELLLKDVKAKEVIVGQSKWTASKFKDENDSLKEEIAKLKAGMDEKERECQVFKAELAKRDEIIAGRTKELDESQRSAEDLIGRFLESRAFTEAVPLAAIDVLRYAIYSQLDDLSSFYPFTSEHIGYDKVPEEKAKVHNLPGYKWDQEEDHLLIPTDRIVEPTLTLNSRDPYIVHHWKGKHDWPTDLNVP